MKVFAKVFIILFLCSCSSNVFDELAEKDTPEAIYFEAQQKINSLDFARAITLLESLENSFLLSRERVPVYASAYSGRCGLVFLTLLNRLQNTGSSSVLGTLMSAFDSATVAQVNDCMQAEQIMVTNIGDQDARDGDENLYMAFNSLAKVGAILSAFADTDNDDTADAGFSACRTADLSDDMVRQIGTGIGVALLSLTAVGTSYVDGAISDVTGLCAVDPNLAVFCSASDPSVFGAAEIQALRLAIASSDFGIDACAGNNFNDCVATFPVNCPL